MLELEREMLPEPELMHLPIIIDKVVKKITLRSSHLSFPRNVG
jgi:hypothetical protein